MLPQALNLFFVLDKSHCPHKQSHKPVQKHSTHSNVCCWFVRGLWVFLIRGIIIFNAISVISFNTFAIPWIRELAFDTIIELGFWQKFVCLHMICTRGDIWILTSSSHRWIPSILQVVVCRNTWLQHSKFKKKLYIQKITSAKYFLKVISVLIRRWQKQAAAVDSTVWDTGVFPAEVLMMDWLYEGCLLFLQSLYKVNMTLDICCSWIKHTQNYFLNVCSTCFPPQRNQPTTRFLQPSPTHIWCCSLTTSRELS